MSEARSFIRSAPAGDSLAGRSVTLGRRSVTRALQGLRGPEGLGSPTGPRGSDNSSQCWQDWIQCSIGYWMSGLSGMPDFAELSAVIAEAGGRHRTATAFVEATLRAAILSGRLDRKSVV